ncbi:Pvc16 family protein [Chitinimonas naiadis]
MIDAAIGHLAGQLNQHLRRCFDLAEDIVVVSNLQEPDGAAVPAVGNKLVLFLNGIERDTAAYRAQGQGTAAQPTRVVGSEPVFLNLMVMCAATFSGHSYPEALKFLSSAIAFFQSKPVLDHQNTPELDPRLERLILNIENLNSSEMHSLWTIHGGRYMPSVLYRVRMVSLDGDHVTRREVLVRETDTRVAG